MRLIDADELLNGLIFPTEQFKKAFTELINDVPTIEAEPKHGRWIKKDGDFWECSECGQRIFSMSKQDREEFHKWCGRCGARMNEVEE